MREGYYKYTYDGPVLAFNTLLTDHWKGETIAPSAQKARSNLIYQFKTKTNRVARTKITLPGEIKMVN